MRITSSSTYSLAASIHNASLYLFTEYLIFDSFLKRLYSVLQEIDFPCLTTWKLLHIYKIEKDGAYQPG